jgi:hypothetical protein
MTNKEDVVEALVRAGADVNYGSPPPVTIAASLGRVRSLNLLIEYDVNLSAEVIFAPTGRSPCSKTDVLLAIFMFPFRTSDRPRSRRELQENGRRRNSQGQRGQKGARRSP